MRLLDQLGREHELIDRVAGSMLAWSQAAHGGPELLARYLAFFRVLVRGFHHEREEEVLFAALVEHAEVSGERGPVAVLSREHRDLDRLTAAVATAADADLGTAVRVLVHAVWEHLDKERSVLLPESRRRLERSGIRSLEGRAPTPEEVAAAADGEALVAAWPPVDDPEIVRGDGCICCSAFAGECHGIEAEWWTDHEWRHHRSLDEG